jgi:hypothetical protein
MMPASFTPCSYLYITSRQYQQTNGTNLVLRGGQKGGNPRQYVRITRGRVIKPRRIDQRDRKAIQPKWLRVRYVDRARYQSSTDSKVGATSDVDELDYGL